MKDIRIGNDINVKWSLLKDGEPFILEGLDISLFLKDMFGKHRIDSFSIQENKILWAFLGREQLHTGKYSLELVINNGEIWMMKTDVCHFVNLVPCSCKVGGNDDSNITTETVDITTEVDFVAAIVDKELSEVSENAIANKTVTKELKEKVSKTDLATINGQSITEGGNIVIQGGGSNPDLSEYAKKEDIATINGKSIINGGNITIEGGSGGGGSYDDTGIKKDISDLKTNDALQDAELAKLSAEVGKLGKPIFKAIYGETKIEDVIAAYESGIVVHCDYNNYCYVLSQLLGGEAYFSAVDGQITSRLFCSKNSNWSVRSFTAEQTANKVTSLSESSTDTQYPSAKAVYEALQNVGGSGASNEWKCVFDGRMEIGVRDIVFTTFADGTPLKAKEMIVQILMDKSAAINSQGYIQVQSTTNENMVYYGAIHFEAVLSNGVPFMSQCKMVASPYTYMVAEIIDKIPLAVAQGSVAWGRAGSNNTAQIYEDFVFLKLGPSNPTTEAAPYLKIYAR